MRIIISPAKKMREDVDSLPPRGLPALLGETERLLAHLRGLSLPELKKLLSCNDQLAQLNYQRYQTMDLGRRLTPALLAYEGIQYRYMAPGVFSQGALDYVEDHLRILSGFYGVLRPFDGVTPYRLEMGARLKTGFCKDLYDFWGEKLAAALDPGGVVLDLASGEYSRAVIPHLPAGTRVITPIFGELRADGKVAEKGVYVKMARGEMVRFLAERGAEDPEAVTAFEGLDFRYCPQRSRADRPVFLRDVEKGADGVKSR